MPPLLRKLLPLGVILGAALSGCAPSQTAHFYTTQEVGLRSGQGEEASIIAFLPKDTPVQPTGMVDSHSIASWRVDTPMGTGWVYTKYLYMSLAESDLQ